MVGQTITRSQLSEAVYQEVGLSRNESADLVESVLNKVSEALAQGQQVKISSFGTFSVRSKGQRIGRNPKTGDEVPILPRKVLVFRPSQVLKNRISGQPIIQNSSNKEEGWQLWTQPMSKNLSGPWVNHL